MPYAITDWTPAGAQNTMECWKILKIYLQADRLMNGQKTKYTEQNKFSNS
jgi:hypothetical protein